MAYRYKQKQYVAKAPQVVAQTPKVSVVSDPLPNPLPPKLLDKVPEKLPEKLPSPPPLPIKQPSPVKKQEEVTQTVPPPLNKPLVPVLPLTTPLEKPTDTPLEPVLEKPIDKPVELPVKPVWVKGKKIIPCTKCIASLRKKLFKLKTDNGMIAYRDIIELAKSYLYDMYSGSTPDSISSNRRNYNIEHSVLAKIVGPRPTDETFPFINKESYHDPHVLFPTNKDINTLRANFVYGQLADSRESALKVSKDLGVNISIVNKDEVLLKSRTAPARFYTLRSSKGIDPSKLEVDDIYIDDTHSVIKQGQDNDFVFCNIGDCVFQPSKPFTGDIARIVFYYFLMYAYDTRARPYTGEIPWIGNVDRTRGLNCQGFDFAIWRTFFFDHLDEYYNWAKNDQINDMETTRNQHIIDITTVPNIFVGYYTSDDVYHTSSFDIIEELLFGKPHDHKKYENIEFHQGDKFIPRGFKNPIAIDYETAKQNNYLYEQSMYDSMNVEINHDYRCGDAIADRNFNANKNQQKLYGPPLRELPVQRQVPIQRQQPKYVPVPIKVVAPLAKDKKPQQPPVPVAIKKVVVETPPQLGGSAVKQLYARNKKAYRDLC